MSETQFVLYPTRIESVSAQRLKEKFKELGHHCFIAKREGTYEPRASDLIIGWGYSRTPSWKTKAEQIGAKWLNHHSLILNSVRKLQSFELMEDAGIPVPTWSTSLTKATRWSEAGAIVFARTSQDGCKGEGITVVKPGELMPDSLFYTVFIPSAKEYRVYVIKGSVVDILEKRPITGETQNEYIRGSEEMGWQFCRQNVTINQSAKNTACNAVAALGLDFGGVDLLIAGATTTVLEVNTAPDIFGSGLQRFVDAFTQIAKAA